MKKHFILLVSALLLTMLSSGQDKLYTNEFSLSTITLFDSPFKKAEDLNIKVLLQYEVDRLLEPFLTEAGLPAKGSRYANWDGLAGHVGGHYLSALAIHYAATGDKECKEKMAYMIAELKRCQDSNGNGYVGGIPGSKALWSELKSGVFNRYNSAWVPWYNLHKTYAGLRDAWLYADNEQARTIFLALCDWGIGIISGLSTNQMQQMLDKEFGGMNEVYADAYQITGDKKYLDAAKKFTHNMLFNAMAAKSDNLDNKHANTQIPKAVGFARIAQLDPSDKNYLSAAKFFWETVVRNRSLALGGNSRSEHFPTAANCVEYTTHREGPESCNTYNMMKLTEDLFKMDPRADYIDYYEKALFNHILSTQHPEHGGYVYFTPIRPRHYRVYSSPNQAMWCCVGSGMENHGKYGQMIYTHQGNDSLFINLFIPSKLNWKEQGLTLTQKTEFPYSESTELILNMNAGKNFKMLVRRPSWAKEGFAIHINGQEFLQSSKPSSYVEIDRMWNDGDTINITLPMQIGYEEMPNVPRYIALMYGPILLGAKTGNQGLDGLVADDGRWAHIANGPLMALNTAPVIVGQRDSIALKITPIEGKAMNFNTQHLFPNQANHQSVVLEPFFNIHDSRYMMYWMSLSHAEYASVMEALSKEDLEALELDQRTVDAIATGEQQPDTDHKVKGTETYTGVHNNEHYRDARNGGFFSYEMATGGLTNLSLMVRYWGNEWGNRTFDILVDNVLIATENVSGKWKTEKFVTVEYAIPANLLTNKSLITIAFKAKAGHTAGGVFYLRLLKPKGEQSSIDGKTSGEPIKILRKEGNIILKTQPGSGITRFNLYTMTGQNLCSGDIKNSEATIKINHWANGVYLLFYGNQFKKNCYKFVI